MAWVETANRVYVDQVVEARFRFACPDGYCSAGMMFRVMENGTYYLALVSGKGYFRLDVVCNMVPKTLVGWTEAAGMEVDGENHEPVTLKIIAKGSDLVFTINGKWVAEVNDDTIPGGHLGFVLASYETRPTVAADGEACRAWLNHLSLDSRPFTVRSEYEKWNSGDVISAKSRWCLAETFAATGRFYAAHDQILKLWHNRENAISVFTATYTEMRSGDELLFAARVAQRLGLYDTAETYINVCLSAEANSMANHVDEIEVLAEKANILNALNRFDDLVAFLPEYIHRLETETRSDLPSLPLLYSMLANAWWNLKNYEAAAAAWSKAHSLDSSNALYAENAAAAYAMPGVKKRTGSKNIGSGRKTKGAGRKTKKA